jgi:heme/copper-type cytochrome/quinol oxidase subunit 3
MPSVLIATSGHMPGCSESGAPEHSHHKDHAQAMQDCSFKPCLDSQSDSVTPFNRMTKLDMPVFILSLIWTFWCLFLTYPPTKVPRKTNPPLGRRILLIYRFCTLLN